MLKIGKGLKKKKKSKHSKHKKDEELFKPEELEQYRREHQQQALAEAAVEDVGTSEVKSGATDNDEWKKFNALTAGVDSILKKTQGDLDRIKSTSFFQKKAPPPKPQPPKQEELEAGKDWIEIKKEDLRLETAASPATLTVPVEDESESEYEEEEDIFDTSFVDVVASGEIKLAYIPESPVNDDTQDGFDPFDTSAADKIIRGPEVSAKGKKLVSIGSAVEVLTGRVDHISTSAISRKSQRRIVNQDLLLDPAPVDTNGNPTEEATSVTSPIVQKAPKSLLDDDDDGIPIDEPIDLSVSLLQKIQPAASSVVTTPIEQHTELGVSLSEFDVLAGPDELDDEFADLAAESLKTVKPVLNSEQIQSQVQATVVETTWDAFGNESTAQNNTDDDFDFNPRADERKLSSVSIHIIDPSGQRESITSLEHVDEDNLNALKPIHRDLLGGSTTDLSTLANQPIEPTEPKVVDELSYTDPFDTSVVDQISVPGKTELKFIEAELLGDTESSLTRSLSDPDFDPRSGEPPVILPIAPILHSEPIGFTKPSERVCFDDEIDENIDPFDTSFVSTVAPGKAELKLIESELAELVTDLSTVPEKLHQILSDPEKLSKPISPPKALPICEPEIEQIDLLCVGEDVDIKALTPAIEQHSSIDSELTYTDPFDTSTACNILPGRAELKLLENELLNLQTPTPKPLVNPIVNVIPTVFSSSKPAPAQTASDLLDDSHTDHLEFKPLTPEKDTGAQPDDIDPFDTSITSTLVPGKVELKLLESELIH